jgi:hypothetical protein
MPRFHEVGRFAAVAGVAGLSCACAQSVAPINAPALPTSTPVVAAAPAPEPGANLARVSSPEPARVSPACWPDTYWDGIACAHARATCGGWDGVTCEPSHAAAPARDRAASEEFARIDSEARSACPEADDSRPVYSGTLPEVCRAIDEAIDRADPIAQRLGRLRDTQQTPRWTVATYARLGVLYDCIWNRVTDATPTLFTPQQQALLAKLNTVAQGLTSAGQVAKAQTVQASIADARRQIEDKWRSTRDRYLAALEVEMVQAYVTAALLARRFGVEGFELTRASPRLPIIASILGDETMSRLLAEVADPTDPEPDASKRRRIVYAAGAFGPSR